MTSVLERLRNETRPLHEQTEQLFYTEPLRIGTLSVDQYRHLLRTHLVFHQALERAIDGYPDFFRAYEPKTRQKTPWLEADLAHLNETVPQAMPDLFADWSPIMLLGAAYVGEGSLLGGSVIWKLLQKNQSIQPLLSQARFYRGYGENTGRYWREFGVFLSQQVIPYPDEVITAAQCTFEIYQTIFAVTNANH